MSFQEHKDFAEALRSYFVEHLPADLLPVKGGSFSLDGLSDNNSAPSMSLQITGSQTLRTYIDGTRIEDLHFTLLYRAPIDRNNAAKSAMLGTLNGIGTWLDGQEPPYLGEDFRISKLEQRQAANVVTQTANSITYQAGFVLGYETQGR
jgi:hypothetical protein